MATRYMWVAMAIAAAFSLVWVVPRESIATDFRFDWLLAKAFVNGVDPYQSMHDLAAHFDLTSAGRAPHPRIPGALVILSPLSILPFSLTHEAGRILAVASAVGLVWVFSRIAGLRFAAVVLPLPAILLLPPFSSVLALGQSDFFIAALIGATLLFGEEDSAIAGTPLGVAITLKLWAWPLAIALMLGRRWRVAISAGATFAVLNILGLAAPNVSVDRTVDALTAVWMFFEPRSLSIPGQFGVSPVATGIALILGLLAWERLGHPEWGALYVLTIPLALIAAPILWHTYLVALAVPMAWLVNRWRSPSSTVRTSALTLNSEEGQPPKP